VYEIGDNLDLFNEVGAMSKINALNNQHILGDNT